MHLGGGRQERPGRLRAPDDLPERLDELAFERLPITRVW
jgi:hypothetical protein